jgi:hypothetical protein
MFLSAESDVRVFFPCIVFHLHNELSRRILSERGNIEWKNGPYFEDLKSRASAGAVLIEYDSERVNGTEMVKLVLHKFIEWVTKCGGRIVDQGIRFQYFTLDSFLLY